MLGAAGLGLEGQIDLAADDRLDAALRRLLGKFERPKQIVGVGHRDRWCAVGDRMVDDPGERQGAFEQRIGGVHAQVDERAQIVVVGAVFRRCLKHRRFIRRGRTVHSVAGACGRLPEGVVPPKVWVRRLGCQPSCRPGHSFLPTAAQCDSDSIQLSVPRQSVMRIGVPCVPVSNRTKRTG